MVVGHRWGSMEPATRLRLGRASKVMGTASLVIAGAIGYAWTMELAEGSVRLLRGLAAAVGMGLVLWIAGRILLRGDVAVGAAKPSSAWPRDELGRVQWPCHACDTFNPVDHRFCLRCGVVARGDRVQIALTADRNGHHA